MINTILSFNTVSMLILRTLSAQTILIFFKFSLVIVEVI